jgi:FkbM family methyltransferase
MVDYNRHSQPRAASGASAAGFEVIEMSEGLTRDHVIWAYRILLDREPESEDAIAPKVRAFRTTRELRNEIVTSEEYQQNNRDFAQANERNLVIKELDGGVRLVIDLADHAIGLNILRGRFELNELDFVRRTVRPGQHVLDIGAHIGLFAMHMAAIVGPAGSVHAFEPFGENADCLEQAVRENRFEDRVVVERQAVGRETGTARLLFAPHSLNTGGAFLAPEGTTLPGHETRPVPSIALDDYPLRRPVSFVKIDVEGAEPLVLAGAQRILREDRPLILSELHPLQLQRVSGVSAAAFVDQVRALGYRCHLLGAGVVGDEMTHVPAGGVTSVVFWPT